MVISEIIKLYASELGDKVYISPSIPEKKLKKTISGITGNKSSSIVAVVDTTIFGTCDNGIAFAEDAMYYKAFLRDPVCIRYEDISSASVEYVPHDALVIQGHNDDIIIKIESNDFLPGIAAIILNNIVEAIKKEKRAKKIAFVVSKCLHYAERLLEIVRLLPLEKIATSELSEEIFEKTRKKVKINAIVLIILGMVFLKLFWWGIPAIIIGIELLVIYLKDARLSKEGMPAGVYYSNTRDLILHAWVGTIVVIGVIRVPKYGSTEKKRIDVIREITSGIKTVVKEDSIVLTYLKEYHEKKDVLGKEFVRGYIVWLERQNKVKRIMLCNYFYVFSIEYFEKIMERIDSLSKSNIRVSRKKMIDGVKEIFNKEDCVIEELINIPWTGIEVYTFSDGVYYVHGINDDRIRVCSSCGIAELVSSDEQTNDGPFFCSDYCRETDIECEKLIHQLRKQRSLKDINVYSTGAVLPDFLTSMNYNKGNVASLSVMGHGIAAENANTMINTLTGHSARVVGSDNARNGADRIVDGVQIQCKYCQTAHDTVNAAFLEKGKPVPYRYIDANGKAMQLEVPRNQYEEAIIEIRKKYHEGKLPPDVKTEADAERLIRKGYITYKQAQNICRFGTIEGLAYDSYTGVIVGTKAAGISFVVTAALSYYQTKDIKKSIQASVYAGLQTGGKAFSIYILSAQLQRTPFIKEFIHQSSIDINYGAHGKTVEHIGKGLDKMSGAKSGSYTKNANMAVKGAIITAAAALVVTSTWEVGKHCCGRISGMQCVKNIAVSGGGIAGGTLCALLGGALLSPIPGGTLIGSTLGAIIGGYYSGKATRAGMDKLIEDDAIMIMALVGDEFMLFAASFCLNDKEIKKATEELDTFILSRNSFVEDVYSKKGFRRRYLARLIRPIFIRICMSRPILSDSDIGPTAIDSAFSNN